MEVTRIFKISASAYDLSVGEIVKEYRYVAGQPMDSDIWKSQMLKAQKLGKRISYSNEWSSAQKYLKERHPDQEKMLTGKAVWTGTVLDFDDETLKGGVMLNKDGTFASVSKILGKKDGIAPVATAGSASSPTMTRRSESSAPGLLTRKNLKTFCCLKNSFADFLYYHAQD